jgi:hypothetical protein
MCDCFFLHYCYAAEEHHMSLYHVASRPLAGWTNRLTTLSAAGMFAASLFTWSLSTTLASPADTTAVSGAVRPVLECVTPHSNGSYTAYFGYRNENAVPVTIPVGSNNKFTPAPADRDQTTVFQPGRIVGAFSVRSADTNLVWMVKGPDGNTRTATASRTSKLCAEPTATVEPTQEPTVTSSPEPTHEPTATPTQEPTIEPTQEPTIEPTSEPTAEPTHEPTVSPTAEPTVDPTVEPTPEPTQPPAEPTQQPTQEPTTEPTQEPTRTPTVEPTPEPTIEPCAASSAACQPAGDMEPAQPKIFLPLVMKP